MLTAVIYLGWHAVTDRAHPAAAAGRGLAARAGRRPTVLRRSRSGGPLRTGCGRDTGGLRGRNTANTGGRWRTSTTRPPSAAAMVRASDRPRPVPSGRVLTLRSKIA